MKSAAILSVLLLAAVASALDTCDFQCGPNQKYDGLFVDADNYPATDYLTWQGFNPNQLPGFLLAKTNDPDLKYPEKDCYLFCELYNSNFSKITDDETATYWMYATTCDSAGGQCYCFHKSVCASGYDPVGERKGDYDAGIVAANYTVGQLCPPGNKGDPHFTGGDGSHYDFSGVPNRNYALISDAHIQVNGFFGGRYDQWGKSVKALTWIRSVGILFGHHTLVLEARSGASAEYDDGFMGRIVADGNDVDVATPGTSVPLWAGASIRWTGARVRSGNDLVDVYEVSVGDVAVVRLTLRPEVAKLRTRNDGTVHFGIDVVRSTFSPAVHGVLGQTYRPDFVGRLEQQKLVWSDLLNTMAVPGDNAEGFIDGAVDDYEVTNLVSADCKFCRFTRAHAVDAETSIAIDMLGGASGGGLPAVPRKFLDVE